MNALKTCLTSIFSSSSSSEPLSESSLSNNTLAAGRGVALSPLTGELKIGEVQTYTVRIYSTLETTMQLLICTTGIIIAIHRKYLNCLFLES